MGYLFIKMYFFGVFLLYVVGNLFICKRDIIVKIVLEDAKGWGG